MNTPAAFGVRATLLTPLAYHGLMVQGGSATVADLLSDTAVAFAMAAALGWMPATPGLPVTPDYRSHLAAMPFRTSLFLPAAVGPSPVLMPPQARKMTIDIEGGRPSRLATVVDSGNVKDYYTIQAVAPGAVYEGVLAASVSPFPRQENGRLVVRMGLGRQTVVLLEETSVPQRVRVNAHTAAWFGREVGCARYHLHTLQASRWMSAEEACAELAAWVG